MAQRRKRTTRKKTSFTLFELTLLLVLFLLIVSPLLHALWIPILFIALTLIIGVIVLWQRLRRHRRLLNRLRTIADLLSLTPTKFELAMGELLQLLGYYNVRHTGGGGDLAADLICIAPQGQLVVVQCKRYAPEHKVGSPDIQKFIGMITVHHQAQIGVFITTSSFTQPALTLAYQHNIQAIDGMQLAQLLAQRHQPYQQVQP